MRDNGISVLVGVDPQRKDWSKAPEDGWTPGETLFSIEEATQKGTLIQYLVSDAAQMLLWPTVKANLKKGDALYFSHGFSVVYCDQNGVIAPDFVDVILVAPKGSGRRRACQFSFWQRDQQQLCRFPGCHRPRSGTNPRCGDCHRIRLFVSYHFPAGSVQ